MEIIYRNAVITDSTELAAVENAIFSYPHTAEQFEFELNDNHYIYYVATKDDKIIAYAGLQYVLDEGYITNIAVIEKYRGYGISNSLMQLIIDKAKELELIFISLEVRQSNTPAIKLYNKFNFEIISTAHGYYKKPTEDALIMTLTLR